MAYLYVLLDPRKQGTFQYGSLTFNHEPFYVGISSQKEGCRPKCHYLDSLLQKDIRAKQHGKGNWRKAKRIIQIKRSHPTPLFRTIKRDPSSAKIKRLERKAIALIGKRDAGGPLLNITDGGDGQTGHSPSKQTRAKISNKNRQRWANTDPALRKFVGHLLSEASRLRRSSMTKEERALYIQNCEEGNKRFWATLTASERKAHKKLLSDNASAMWDNMSRKQRRAFIDAQNEGKAARTVEQRAETSRKLSLSGKEYWASLSKKQRTAYVERITAGVIKSRPKAVKSYLKTLKSLSKKERAAWNANISSGLKEYYASPENQCAIAAAGEKRSATAKARTDRQRAALKQKFRAVQKNLPVAVQKKKNKKVSRGLKKYRSSMTEQARSAESERQSKAVQSMWDGMDSEQRSVRASKTAQAVLACPQLRARKNSSISKTIREQHATASEYDKVVRKFNVMVGGLVASALRRGEINTEQAEHTKQRLRASGAKYYATRKNLKIKPTSLRERCKRIIYKNG